MSQNNLKNENIAITLIKFCTPLIMSGILQQLYNWADAFIVGNVNGETALAAIGAVGSISSFYLMAIAGFTTGLSILMAQKFGSGQYEDIRKILSTFVVVIGAVALVIATAGFCLAGPVLALMDTPADIFSDSKSYLQIICTGIPFMAIYNLYSATLRAVGDSRAPFLAVFVSSVVNIVLDIIFVAFFHWGVTGAAVATIIAQIAMTLFMIIYGAKKHPLIRFRLSKNMLCSEVIGKSIFFGAPPMIQSCINSFGNLILQGFMNGFGTATVAAITTAYRVDCIALLPVINLGSGISTLVAQSFGAKDNKRAWKVFRVGTVMMTVVAAVLTFIVVVFGGKMIEIFGAGQEVVAIGANFFRSIAMFYVIYGLAMACRGYVEGVGKVMYSSITGISVLALRIVLSYVLKDVFDNMVIAYAEGISWVVLMVLFAVKAVVHNRKITQNV